MFNNIDENKKNKIYDSDIEKELKNIKPNKLHYEGISKLYKEVRKNIKLEYCYYCHKDCTSFCESHSVPRFILKNISDEGKLIDSLVMLGELSVNYSEVGLKKAGTFYLICNQCDSKVFSNYENPDNYVCRPTNEMMCEIALKNYLNKIYQLTFNVEEFRLIEELGNVEIARVGSDKLRLNRYEDLFQTTKSTFDFEIIYYNRLDYIVPIAVQDGISLLYDLDGKKINNFDEKIEEIHICIFPMKTESIILMFKNKSELRLNGFVKQFKKLGLKDRLDVINYLVFVYSDRFLLSKQLDNMTVNKLKPIVNYNAEEMHQILTFSKIKDTPNILLSK